jgi:hypothetical protein
MQQPGPQLRTRMLWIQEADEPTAMGTPKGVVIEAVELK